MTKRLDPQSREILQFRPNIHFVEPEVTPDEITGTDNIQLEDVEETRRQVKQLANAVNVLATAVQARADDKAKEMKITLDINADLPTVQAMQRHFPGENPLEITYSQYRFAKDLLRDLGEEIGKKAIISPDEVAAERDNAIGDRVQRIGGLPGKDGSLRPELDKRSQIIEPVDMQEVQLDLLCILGNSLWKKFMKPIFDLAGIPSPIGISIGSLLPDQLCNPGSSVDPEELQPKETPVELTVAQATASAIPSEAPES